LRLRYGYFGLGERHSGAEQAAMPRDGSLTLSDIRGPTLAIGCERCGRHGRYNVQRLIAAHGADAKLTELLVTLANCEKARSFSVYSRCKARFEGFSFRA
jgi:hypothetical protein